MKKSTKTKTAAPRKAGNAKENARIEIRLDWAPFAMFLEAHGDIPAATYIRRLVERDVASKGIVEPSSASIATLAEDYGITLEKNNGTYVATYKPSKKPRRTS